MKKLDLNSSSSSEVEMPKWYVTGYGANNEIIELEVSLYGDPHFGSLRGQIEWDPETGEGILRMMRNGNQVSVIEVPSTGYSDLETFKRIAWKYLMAVVETDFSRALKHIQQIKGSYPEDGD